MKNSGMVCVAAGPDDFREKKSQVRLCEPSHLVVAGESSTSLRGHAGLVLDHSDHDAWLTGKVGVELLRPAPNDLLRMWPVSKRVNASGRGDYDPNLVEPVEDVANVFGLAPRKRSGMQ